MHKYLSLKDPVTDGLADFFEYTKDIKIDYAMAAGLSVSKSEAVHKQLEERKIPYFFVSQKLADLELDKSLTKMLLNKLGIPTPKCQTTDGGYLYENFFKIPRPFVVKLNYVYLYGKQTMIVTDDNYKEVYEELFSLYTSGDYRLCNITKDTKLLIEEYVELKKEYSYHALFNKANWQYFGSARDYKRLNENDKGPNSVSLGSYSIVDVDPVVHEYAEKIYNFLKVYLQDDHYKGFIFLGIGIGQDGVPMILEINTRSGDPELPAILGTVTNNLSELFYSASADLKIPEIKHNNKEAVVVRVINRVYDWNTPASFLPDFKTPPKGVSQYIDTGYQPEDDQVAEYTGIKHSIFVSSATNRKKAAEKIYNYLDKQYIGQFTYRRDIGIME
jgi:phosphoribosylamine--glycine ligase